VEEQWEDGYLIVQLLIEERNPAHVARELGVSQADLLEMSRDALEDWVPPPGGGVRTATTLRSWGDQARSIVP
jgi:hypothetical protein